MARPLTADELGPFLGFVIERFVAVPIAPAKHDELFEIMDITGDGECSYPEFLWFMSFLKVPRPCVEYTRHCPVRE